MHSLAKVSLLIASVLAIPTLSSAQTAAGIAGVVKDDSGAVLPGVTVEAASPVLIERVRTVTTDSTGQYRIINLPPGTYTVTFTLAGFNIVKREGIQLTGSFVATANADMKVGGIEETITVTGETPVVDTHSVTREQVLNKEVIDAVPSGRSDKNLSVLVLGVVGDRGNNMNQDVGGSAGAIGGDLIAHGSRGDDTRTMTMGTNVGVLTRGGQNSGAIPNMGAFQEVAVAISGISAEYATGGVMINMIPRDGGNTFRGSVFTAYAGSSMSSSNLTDALTTAGLKQPNSLNRNVDFNPAFGGPIKKDRTWFWLAYRYFDNSQNVSGILDNLNAGNPNAFTYVPDPNSKPSAELKTFDGHMRVLQQIGSKNKIGFTYNPQHRQDFPQNLSPLTSPEATSYFNFWSRNLQANFNSTITNRLLLEVGYFNRHELFPNYPTVGIQNAALNPILEQSSNLTYRGLLTQGYTLFTTQNYKTTLSYVTGAHDFKVGMNLANGENTVWSHLIVNNPVSFQYNNSIPNRITQSALEINPTNSLQDLDADLGIYAQDKWTVGRLSASYGLRFDFFRTSFPARTIGPAQLAPNRNVVFPDSGPIMNWKDLSPRVGVIYDLFGDGKTAIRVSVNRYLLGYTFNLGSSQIGAAGVSVNPQSFLNTSAARAWTDANNNRAPDCDLTNLGTQDLRSQGGDFCGALPANFGTAVPSFSIDPSTLSGFDHRGYTWEFATGIQREILPRVSVDVGYYRRIYGNLVVTDNLALAASDYSLFNLTVPSDPRLPGGGGYTVTGIADVDPAKFSLPANNFVTFADNYGKAYEHWDGIDVSMNARTRIGLTLQGGFSSGRRVTDYCAVQQQAPETGFAAVENAGTATWTPQQYCHQDYGWTTQIKGIGVYTIPRADVQVSGAFQSLPGRQIFANWTVPNATAAAALGRSLAGNAPNISVQIEPYGIYGERVNQLDLRFQKVFRLASRRLSAGLDLYNALNSSVVLVQSSQFATWQVPQTIIQGRIAKVSVQVDF